MNPKRSIQEKILSREALEKISRIWHAEGKKIVFTNGCFDILHQGHLQVLTASAGFGDVLVVGLNTDASVKRLKGPERPVNDEDFRLWMMASLELVDAVSVFDEPTPKELVAILQPDVIVKGGDYTPDQVVGASEVLARGGEVKIIPIVQGYSTTSFIETIRKL
ncbi:MAG: D-glycero-beta-D-manno-heptose 1-phosphate adenylyltransferase [Sphingobacteriales bacterium]|nr:MAG: D-glycero-beta-D-manno-heptose 1-phosphate adenylyltransferase [Sphingobacteriales bacterium]